MSGWNSHSFRGLDTAVLQHPAPRMLDQSRPVRIETGMSVEEAYFIPIPQIDDAEYGGTGGKEEFCSKHNLLNSIAYINQVFNILFYFVLSFLAYVNTVLSLSMSSVLYIILLYV